MTKSINNTTTDRLSPLIPPRYGSPFHDLPSETLNYLFKYLFAHKSTPITVTPFETHATISEDEEEYYSSSGGRLCAEESPRSAQILAVCQRFAEEGTPVLYGDNALELRGAVRRVAQLLYEDWWRGCARYMLREVVLGGGGCMNYLAVGKQVSGLHGHRLERIVVAPDMVVLRGLVLLDMGVSEVREAALREAARLYALVRGRGRDLVDDVIELTDVASPCVEIVLRIAVKLEYKGGNIEPPYIFEYEMLDLVGQDDDYYDDWEF